MSISTGLELVVQVYIHCDFLWGWNAMMVMHLAFVDTHAMADTLTDALTDSMSDSMTHSMVAIQEIRLVRLELLGELWIG